jgi:hypothetical protein
MGGIEGQLVIGLSGLVLAWYFLGQQAMRRRGLALLQWVRAGLPILGDSPRLRWLGASAFQLTIERPAAPLKAVSVTVVLEPREIFLLWLVNRVRQRRDVLVVRADFTVRPTMRFELFRAAGRSGHEAQAMAKSARWPTAPFDQSGLRLAAPFPLNQELLRPCIDRLHDQMRALTRLSIRETSPHLLLNYQLRPGQEGDVSGVFHFLRELGRILREGRADDDRG